MKELNSLQKKLLIAALVQYKPPSPAEKEIAMVVTASIITQLHLEKELHEFSHFWKQRVEIQKGESDDSKR